MRDHIIVIIFRFGRQFSCTEPLNKKLSVFLLSVFPAVHFRLTRDQIQQQQQKRGGASQQSLPPGLAPPPPRNIPSANPLNPFA